MLSLHFGRPGTPTDRAWIESFFSHLKAEFPHLLKITEPPSRAQNSITYSSIGTPSGCTQASGT